MSANMSLALNQIDRIALLCEFLTHPEIQTAIDRSVPVTMPHDIGSLGFDTHLWIGLGTVGLWSALDAFADRANFTKPKCQTCDRSTCLWSRFSAAGTIYPAQALALKELEDVRHLFAHNYAGQADAMYFGGRWKRHVFSSSVRVSLSSGAVFDGAYLALSAAHLRYYADQSRQIVRSLS